METVLSIAEALFGSGRDLAVHQMVLRALVAYPMALAMLRVGGSRFLGQIAAFDFLLAVVIGSILSRAISGNAPFWPSMLAALALVLLHRFLAMLAVRWAGFARVLKGHGRVLVRDGEIDWKQMRRAGIGEQDLEEEMRLEGKVQEVADVAVATLERNGRISVIPRGDRG